jgi:hypothetical protein
LIFFSFDSSQYYFKVGDSEAEIEISISIETCPNVVPSDLIITMTHVNPNTPSVITYDDTSKIVKIQTNNAAYVGKYIMSFTGN